MKSFNEWRKLKESEDRHRCLCENTNCDHGNKNCTRTQERFVSTIYGTYPMCDICAKNMPTEFLDHEKIARDRITHKDAERDLKNGIRQYNSLHGTDHPVD